MYVIDQLRNKGGVFVIERDLRCESVWSVAHVIDDRESGDQLGAGGGRKDRIRRSCDEHQQRHAGMLQTRKTFRVRGNHWIEIAADNGGAGLGDADGLGRIDYLSSSVQLSISTRKIKEFATGLLDGEQRWLRGQRSPASCSDGLWDIRV